jgi:hypothetical protein
MRELSTTTAEIISPFAHCAVRFTAQCFPPSLPLSFFGYRNGLDLRLPTGPRCGRAGSRSGSSQNHRWTPEVRYEFSLANPGGLLLDPDTLLINLGPDHFAATPANRESKPRLE